MAIETVKTDGLIIQIVRQRVSESHNSHTWSEGDEKAIGVVLHKSTRTVRVTSLSRPSPTNPIY